METKKLQIILEHLSAKGVNYNKINGEINKYLNEVYDILHKNTPPKSNCGFTYLIQCIKYFGENVAAHIQATRDLQDYYKTFENNEEMETFYIILAEIGDVHAMFNLGSYYSASQDYLKMEHYYLMAAERGELYSIHNIATYYFCQKNYKKMKLYYHMAIEKGCVASMNSLGIYYQYIEKNFEKMEKYFLMGIQKNSFESMVNLGLYYNISEDYLSMEKCLLMALKNEDLCQTQNRVFCSTESFTIKKESDDNNMYHPKYLMHILANYYEKSKDYENMIKYRLMAIEAGDWRSMYSLGLYYKKTKDFQQMLRYFNMGVEKDDTNAMNSLGLYYKSERDYEKMVRYFNMAIEKGEVASMVNLGCYYKKIKNYRQMEKYLIMATEKSYVKAMDILVRYYKSIKDFKQMEKFCLMAIQKEHSESLQVLEQHYEKNAVIFYELLSELPQNRLIQSKLLELDCDSSIIWHKKRINEMIQEECIICFEIKNSVRVTISCKNHMVCLDCVKSITKCPYKCE